ncbi:MAG TPA: AMP-binding protein, partial [Pyrinomonadaceae bacterium]|nr:AMP-binding protein [Pyrinomonadaceae bacterium]
MNYPTIYSLFMDRVRKYPADKEVFYFRSRNEWRGISWRRFEQETLDFATALLSHDLRRGGSVCILMGNVPEWPISDIGTIIAGGVGVGLYPMSSAEQIAYIINHSDAEFVLVDSREQLAKVLSVRDQLPKVRHVIALDSETSNGVISYRDFVAQGHAERSRLASLLNERAASAKPDDGAIMVYTSGTTGAPKGACLSHRYIINSVESLRQTIPIYDTDVSFSYLPFCHVAERISGL